MVYPKVSPFASILFFALELHCSSSSKKTEGLISFSNPSSTARTLKTSSDDFATPWTLDFGDGNGNRYIFTKEGEFSDAQFEYIPMTFENSSSGIYSGGTPKKGVVVQKNVEELLKLVSKMKNEKKYHLEERRMETGHLFFKSPELEFEFSIDYDSETLRQFIHLVESF